MILTKKNKYGLRKTKIKIVDGGSMIEIGARANVPQPALIGAPATAPVTTIVNGSGIEAVLKKATNKKRIKITL